MKANSMNMLLFLEILPDQTAKLHSIPFFVMIDYEQEIEKVQGVLEVSYYDTFLEKHITRQEFFFFPYYSRKQTSVAGIKLPVHVTFGDLLETESAGTIHKLQSIDMRY